MLRALVAAVCALAIGTSVAAAADPPRATDLEAELVCPVCDTTLDQSTAPVAERMKLYIRQRIAAGDSEEEIKDALVAEFGPGVLARPRDDGFGLLAWLLPLAGVLAAAVAVAVLVRGWSRGRPAGDDEPPLDPDLERRLDDELARFES